MCVCFLPQGYCIENTRLVVRYPDRRPQRVLPFPLRTCLPVTQQAGAAAGWEAPQHHFRTLRASNWERRFELLPFLSFWRPRQCGPVNGDQCYFWRTTGCHFGDKCRYKHIPDQKGKDRKPWQPWTRFTLCLSCVLADFILTVCRTDWNSPKGQSQMWLALRQGGSHMCHNGLEGKRCLFLTKAFAQRECSVEQRSLEGSNIMNRGILRFDNTWWPTPALGDTTSPYRCAP